MTRPDTPVITSPTRTIGTDNSPVELDRTRTIGDLIGIDTLVSALSIIRWHAKSIENDARRVDANARTAHLALYNGQLEKTARVVAGRATAEMLERLSAEGFAWRDVARMVGVSVPAVRRWRSGEPPTGPHHLDIARLVALVDLLREQHEIANVGTWMEMPLADSPLTGIDLVAARRFVDLFELAEDERTAEDVLDEWDPDWRERYHTDAEVFVAADGEIGLGLSEESED